MPTKETDGMGEKGTMPGQLVPLVPSFAPSSNVVEINDQETADRLGFGDAFRAHAQRGAVTVVPIASAAGPWIPADTRPMRAGKYLVAACCDTIGVSWWSETWKDWESGPAETHNVKFYAEITPPKGTEST